MGIFLALADYDGKQTALLREIMAARPADDEVLAELVNIVDASEPNVSIGASWLLRAYLEDGASLDPASTSALAESLKRISDPWARLHICQTVRSLDVIEEDTPAFVSFVRECRTSERPFLRAWATDGLHALAAQHAEYQAEAARAVTEALADPAASVRARACRILAES